MRTSIHYRVGFFGLALMAVMVIVAIYYLGLALIFAAVVVAVWRGARYLVRAHQRRQREMHRPRHAAISR